MRPGNARAVIASEQAHECGRILALPRHAQCAARPFAFRRLIVEGRQRLAGFHLSRRHNCGTEKILTCHGWSCVST